MSDEMLQKQEQPKKDKFNKEFLDRCYYFGVWDVTRLGHFLFQTNGQYRFSSSLIDGFPFTIAGLDSTLILDPKQSRALLIHVNGWTIMAMSDYTGDGRRGAKSIFVIPAKGLNLNEAKEAAKAAFPEQYERIVTKEDIV